jgi:hypothetical protein
MDLQTLALFQMMTLRGDVIPSRQVAAKSKHLTRVKDDRLRPRRTRIRRLARSVERAEAARA